MKCPNCGGKSEVTHTRTFPDYARRRRVCRECGRVFITYETLKPPGERYPMGHPWGKKGKPEPQVCKYNSAVVCEDSDCAICGWNPCKKERKEH